MYFLHKVYGEKYLSLVLKLCSVFPNLEISQIGVFIPHMLVQIASTTRD